MSTLFDYLIGGSEPRLALSCAVSRIAYGLIKKIQWRVFSSSWSK
jgi:hypothetical protein